MMSTRDTFLQYLTNLLWKFYHSPGNSLHFPNIRASLADNSAHLRWNRFGGDGHQQLGVILLTCGDGTVISTVSRMSSLPEANPSSRSFWKIRYCAFHCASGPPTMVTRRCCPAAAAPDSAPAAAAPRPAAAAAASPAAALPPPAASSSSGEAIFTEDPENFMMLRIWLPFVPKTFYYFNL